MRFILFAILVFMLSCNKNSTIKTQCRSILSNTSIAYNSYFNENKIYPSTLERIYNLKSLDGSITGMNKSCPEGDFFGISLNGTKVDSGTLIAFSAHAHKRDFSIIEVNQYGYCEVSYCSKCDLMKKIIRISDRFPTDKKLFDEIIFKIKNLNDE